MTFNARAAAALGLASVAIPAIAQVAFPGAPDAKRVAAGSYKVELNHTQVLFTVNHMGFTPLCGSFPASGGMLEIDPAKPSAAKVSVSFNIADLSTTSAGWTRHMMTAEIFDAAKYPTATFTSTKVESNGDRAKITGNLTVRGVTKPVVLDAKFFGAGTNANSKKLNIGFTATGRIKRSDWGFAYAQALVSDDVDLQITGAFEKL